MHTYAFDLPEIKNGEILYILTIFHSLILAADNVIYLYFVIINDNYLNELAVTPKLNTVCYTSFMKVIDTSWKRTYHTRNKYNTYINIYKFYFL